MVDNTVVEYQHGWLEGNLRHIDDVRDEVHQLDVNKAWERVDLEVRTKVCKWD
jgi:hypothetical protein